MVFYFPSSYSHPSYSFCDLSAYIFTVSPLALFLCPQWSLKLLSIQYQQMQLQASYFHFQLINENVK